MSVRESFLRLLRRRPRVNEDPAALARQAIAAMRKDAPMERDRSGADFRDPDPSHWLIGG